MWKKRGWDGRRRRKGGRKGLGVELGAVGWKGVSGVRV